MKSLKFATQIDQDNEEFVRNQIKTLGVKEFKYASKRLRGDAEFIFSLLKDYPEVLLYASSKIHERYTDIHGQYVDNPDGKNLMFALSGCSQNINVYKYLDEELAKEYYKRVQEGYVVKGMYLGCYITWFVALSDVDAHLKVLTDLRPEIKDMIDNECAQNQ